MGKENESASKMSGVSKSSGASIMKTDSPAKKLKECLEGNESVPSEVKHLCKEVLKQLKKAEDEIHVLQHIAKVSKEDYRKVFNTSMAKSAEIQRERDAKIHFQTMYYAMRTPEVVRTEITKFEERRRNRFNSKDINTEGLEEHAISNEVRAEYWKFMLKTLDDSGVRFLKRSIIFKNLVKDKPEYFSKADPACFKNIENATGNERSKLNAAIEKWLLQRWLKTDFIKSLFEYLETGSCTDDSCQTWCNAILDNFADTIAKIFSIISKIHDCAFDEDDDLPEEYRTLKEPEYEATIILLMSHYVW